MIHSIYVKSYLKPDKKKESKRKTEEVKVDSSESHIHWKRKKEVGVQHVFTPANFKFSRALEYNGVTADHVKEKSIEIEVCVTQRYSHRSFLIGMVRMSLKSAVKKLVKEKIPLIPCMNHTIPSNMKVYCASDLNVMNNTPGGNIFFSNPNVRIVLPEDSDDISDKAASNPDLQRAIALSPSTEIDLESQYKYVPEVPKLDLSNLTLNESGYSSEFHISLPSELESPDSDSSKFSTSSPIKDTQVNLGSFNVAESRKAKPGPALDGIQEHRLPDKIGASLESFVEITDLDSEDLETIDISKPVSDKGIQDKQSPYKVDSGHSGLNEVTVESNAEIEKSKSKEKKNMKKGKSKADKLTWDYSDIPEVVTQETEITKAPWKEGAAPVLFPMETTMGISVTQETKLAQSVEREKSQRRSKHRYIRPVPGSAVAIPEIIITKPKKEKKPKGVKETVVHIPDHGVELKEHSSDSEINDSKTVAKSELPTSCKISAEIVTKPAKPGLKMVDRKSFINVGNTIGKNNKENVSEKSDTKYSKDSKISKLQGFKFFSGNKSKGKTSNLLFDKDVSKISDKTVEHDLSLTGVIVDKSGKKVVKSEDSESISSSVVLDMDRISIQSSGAHVIEVIDEDISITEIDNDDQLFTDRSEAPSLGGISFGDVESGFSEYKLPECKSPTKYMIPMQVYDVDDTSCDEMSIDESYDEPMTEL